jgi:hypothetical protein
MPSDTESKAAFSRRIGVSRVRIGQLVAQGLPTNADGDVLVAAALSWIEANLDPTARARARPRTDPPPRSAPPTSDATAVDDDLPPDDDHADFVEVKRRHELLKAERTKLRLSIERQEAALWSEINQTLTGWVGAERDSWLSWCQRIVPTLQAELKVDGSMILVALRREVMAHLAELSSQGEVHVGP